MKRRDAEAAVLGADGSRLRTFEEIEAESGKLEKLLDAVPARSVVGVQIGNSVRWPALLLALFRRALIPLPLGGHMQRAELAEALETCRASALITEQGIQDLGRARFECDEPPPDFLKLTSGTTSAPRAVRFRAAQLLADCENICATMGIGDGDLNYGAIPFSHSYGFSNLLTPLLCRGVPLVATEDRLPRAMLDGLARTGATVFPGMPIFYQKFAEMDATPLPALRLCISAGAPLPRSVGEQFTAKFGVKIHTFYGSSECGGIGYDATAEAYEDGFVGVPMRGVEVAHDLAEAGPIVVSGAAVGDGYFPDEDRAVLGDGRFIPGDLIRRTERGMFLAGRTAEFINLAGRKLNPLEVEARLAECPGVKQAVVFGVRSELRGEEAVACVAGEIEREALVRFCREKLSPWQAPRDFWIVAEIPVSERGKISRRALAEHYSSRSRGV